MARFALVTGEIRSPEVRAGFEAVRAGFPELSPGGPARDHPWSPGVQPA